MRLLWSASGGDRFILERATYSDQIKYMCLGGIIVATGLMAALAGGYAFFTIFSPRGSAIESENYFYTIKEVINGKEIIKDITNWKLISTTLLSILFGCFWGLMIFNLDRFIVSSTGKGDGTEAITWDEFKGAIPRLVLGAIIALTISKPVEIRMFKSEIDAALHEEQLKTRKDYEKRTRLNFEDRLALIDKDLGEFESKRTDLVDRIKKAENEHTDQLQGRAGAPAGDGKLAQALLTIKDNLILELNRFDDKNKERIKELTDNKRKLILEMDDELSKNEKVANGLDGLLERIKLADKVSAKREDGTYGFPWISLFITLLFLAIEMTPIFFKLMLVKSPYDFLKENVEELMKAEQGIHIEYNYHKDKEGQERDLVTHLHKEKLLVEKKSLQKVQEELTEYAISKYKEEMKKKIDANPEQFIKVQENQNGQNNES